MYALHSGKYKSSFWKQELEIKFMFAFCLYSHNTISVFPFAYPLESGYSLWNWNKESCLWNPVLCCTDKRWPRVYFRTR